MYNLNRQRTIKTLIIAILFNFFVLLIFTCNLWAINFRDDLGKEINLQCPPEKVVSLVPSITEIIFALGAEDKLQAVTYHSTYPSGVVNKDIVGGFFSPCTQEIKAQDPDLIFVSPIQKKVREHFSSTDCQVITLKTESIADSYKDILLLGKVFEKQNKAHEIVQGIKNELELIRKKTAKIPDAEKKRVIRLMGRDKVMTPGEDSFQNQMIRLAGGIPPQFGKKGSIVSVSKEEWQEFNPQVIYGCGGDREVAEKFFSKPGWKDVQAVEKGQIYWFPCDLTCRAATNTGYFVSWLAANIYAQEFSKPQNLVKQQKVNSFRSISLDLDFIAKAGIAYSRIHDFINKSLVIDLKKPMTVVSTLEGQREGILHVGNHYSPPPCWMIGHGKGLKGVRSRVYETIGLSEKDSSFLFTGADMDNLSVQEEKYKDMRVYALVTAGVKSNAVRMSRDKGRFYEPGTGTINILVMSNMRLTPRAMTRAIISATEAKTAALMDMDVRSAYSSLKYRATGTGTDNVLVVEGTGQALQNAGGHSKLGELIAKAVYAGVQEAVYKQNSLVTKRNVFQRLKDRKITMHSLISEMNCQCSPQDRNKLIARAEKALLDPKYSNFLEAAFTLSDDYQKGLLTDLSAFRIWCKEIASGLAGKPVNKLQKLIEKESLPQVQEMALNALLNGVFEQKHK